MPDWRKYQRKNGVTSDTLPLITIARGRIVFNVPFMIVAKLEEMKWVVIYTNPKRFCLGFRFEASAPDDDAFALAKYGRTHEARRACCVHVATLMHDNPWLAAIAANPDDRLRRFEPEWSHSHSMWVIRLAPCFEHRVSATSHLINGLSGIYRYKRGDEIVYIGRGKIGSVAGGHHKHHWEFDTIEYSLVADEVGQIRWQTFWLDHFVEQQGKVPRYNSVPAASADEGRSANQAAAAAHDVRSNSSTIS